MSLSDNIENVIIQTVQNILSQKTIPNLPTDLVATDNLAEVIEKLCILHIRTWFLEDMAGVAKSDEELAALKRKIDICFKQKRPQLVQAINRMVDAAIVSGRGTIEDSVKVYKGHE